MCLNHLYHDLNDFKSLVVCLFLHLDTISSSLSSQMCLNHLNHDLSDFTFEVRFPNSNHLKHDLSDCELANSGTS